jgi:hypothetical protein
MSGRRCLTLVALVAALFLIAPIESAAAQPGKHLGHAKGHGGHSAGVHERHSTSGPGLEPSYRGATGAGANSHVAAGVRGVGTDAHHRKARGYFKHPSHHGKAKGLFTHTDRPGKPVGQHPDTPPVVVTAVDEPYVAPPTHHSSRHQPSAPTPRVHHHDGGPGTPPSEGPNVPPDRDVAQLLQHTKALTFAVLPIAIISILALGVCGLIGLARYRAAAR